MTDEQLHRMHRKADLIWAKWLSIAGILGLILLAVGVMGGMQP